MVLVGLIHQNVAAGDQKQALIAFKEKAGGIGQMLSPAEGENLDGTEEDGIDHRDLCFLAGRQWWPASYVKPRPQCNAGPETGWRYFELRGGGETLSRRCAKMKRGTRRFPFARCRV